jgi:hypothetical protein
MGAGFTRRDAASQKGTVMSETTTTEPVVETPTAPVEPVTKTDEPLGAPGLAALQAERDAREKAEKRLKEFEDRDKTEAEKLAERATAAEKRAEELEAKAIRAEVAAAKGVPVNLLSGSTQQELEASADALIAFRGEQASTAPVVPTEGNSSTPKPDSDREFVKQLFGGTD